MSLLVTASTASAEAYEVPAEGFENALRDRLATVEPGDRIVLPKGRFQLSRELVLVTRQVEVVGQGKEDTVLDFSSQTSGGQSFLVRANGVKVSGFKLVDPPSDGLVVRGARGIEVRDVSVVWTSPHSTSNGGYGIYPVQSKDVLVENCYAQGASEAGIYVGQSVTGVVRGNTVEGNVIGLDIENSTAISIEDNTVRDNSIGILVSARPELLQRRSFQVRVVNNTVGSNNLENFAAPGTYVAAIGSGKGIAVIAASGTVVERNVLREHRHSHVMLLHYDSLGLSYQSDPLFRPALVGTKLIGNTLGELAVDKPEYAERWQEAKGVAVLWDGIEKDHRSRPGPDSAPVCVEGENQLYAFDVKRFTTSGETRHEIPRCRRDDDSPAAL